MNTRAKFDVSSITENSISNKIKKKIAEDPDYVYKPCDIRFTDIRKEDHMLVEKAIWRGI